MYNEQLVDYIRHVIRMGYFPDQIERALIQKGYQKSDVDEMINDVIKENEQKSVVHKIFHRFATNVSHEDFLSTSNPKMVDYIRSALAKGYYPDQIERVLVGAGYEVYDVKRVLEILTKKQKTVHVSEREFLRRMDEKLINYVEKELDLGYFDYQIEKILLQSGYDESDIKRLVKILGSRRKKIEISRKLMDAFGKIEHFDIMSFETKHFIGYIIPLITIFFISSIALFNTFPVISHLLISVITFFLATRMLSSLTIDVMRKVLPEEISDSQISRIIVNYALIVVALELIFPTWFLFICIIPTFYLFTTTIRRTFNMDEKESISVGLVIGVIGAVIVYLILAVIGFFIGIYTVLIK